MSVSGKRIVRRPKKFEDSEATELQTVNRTDQWGCKHPHHLARSASAPYVRVRFDEDGEEQLFGSLLTNELLDDESDEPLKFEELFVGRKVGALWRKTRHYEAEIIEVFSGSSSSQPDSQNTSTDPPKKDSKEEGQKSTALDATDKKKKQSKPPKGKRGKKNKNEESTLVEDDIVEEAVKKKKKEIQAEKNKQRAAQANAAQQLAASLFNNSATSLLACEITTTPSTNSKPATSIESIYSENCSSNQTCQTQSSSLVSSSACQEAPVLPTLTNQSTSTKINNSVCDNNTLSPETPSLHRSGTNFITTSASATLVSLTPDSISNKEPEKSSSQQTYQPLQGEFCKLPNSAIGNSLSYCTDKEFSGSYTSFLGNGLPNISPLNYPSHQFMYPHMSLNPWSQSMQPVPSTSGTFYNQNPSIIRPSFYRYPPITPWQPTPPVETITNTNKHEHEIENSETILDISQNRPKESSSSEVIIEDSIENIITSSLNVVDASGDEDSVSANTSTIMTSSHPHSPNTSSQCSECTRKDKEIYDLKQTIRELQSQGVLTPRISTDPRQSTKKHKPKTRPKVEFAEYVMVDGDQPPPDGYHQLAPGAVIAVKSLWMHDVLSSLKQTTAKRERKAAKKGKTISVADKNSETIKRLMDGFYDPWDLNREGGTTSFESDPVFKSLKLYAEHILKMGTVQFKRAWNTKMATCRYFCRKEEGVQLPSKPRSKKTVEASSANTTTVESDTCSSASSSE